jgi:hypothetical protein
MIANKTTTLGKLVFITLLAGSAQLAFAQTATTDDAKPADAAPKALTCDSLKQTITEKLEAKGVKNYQLDIVDTSGVPAEAKVVGSCDGGKHKIVYAREVASKN